MKRRFVIYGMVGWILEVLWTGLGSLFNGDIKLLSYTSIWMFPIYGLAAFFEPVCDYIKKWNVLIRGGVYTICIFLIEYATGMLLRKVTGMCPWDYSSSKFNISGIIRLDYAPVWFVAGLFFERLHIYIKEKNFKIF